MKVRIAERPGFLRTLGVLFAHSGDSWFWLVGLSLLWFAGNEYWKPRALAMIVGVLVTAILVMTIKFTVRRRRPEGEWGKIYRSADPHSFPSGHAARCFMLAVIMLVMGPEWLGVGLFLWAVLVSLARVAMGVHYISDVLAGWMIGLCLGLVIPRFF